MSQHLQFSLNERVVFVWVLFWASLVSLDFLDFQHRLHYNITICCLFFIISHSLFYKLIFSSIYPFFANFLWKFKQCPDAVLLTFDALFPVVHPNGSSSLETVTHTVKTTWFKQIICINNTRPSMKPPSQHSMMNRSINPSYFVNSMPPHSWIMKMPGRIPPTFTFSFAFEIQHNFVVALLTTHS